MGIFVDPIEARYYPRISCDVCGILVFPRVLQRDPHVRESPLAELADEQPAFCLLPNDSYFSLRQPAVQKS